MIAPTREDIIAIESAYSLFNSARSLRKRRKTSQTSAAIRSLL